jgi:hypothetical protein
MKMDVIASVSRAAALALALVAVILMLLLAWIGGELHYGNCVAGAEARHPIAYEGGRVVEEAARTEAVDGCSRWP